MISRPVCGAIFRISLAVSKPKVNIGAETSRITKSGLSCRTCSIASWPDAASQTSRSARLSRSARSDFLIRSCVLAINSQGTRPNGMRCTWRGLSRPACVLSCGTPLRSASGRSGRRNGNSYGNFCTPVTGRNLKSPSQVFHPLAHASQTEPMSTGSLDDL